MEFQTRPKSQVLDDLIAKLEAMPPRHPDRPTIIRMIIDLRREIERSPQRTPPGDRGAC